MYTQKKPIDNTHIVRERDRRRNRELFAVLSLGVPIGLFLLLFTWQNLEVIRLGREATRLQRDLKDVEAQHKALQAELDRRTSFDAVETKAAALGFQTTDAKTIVIVESPRGNQGAGRRASDQGAGRRAQDAEASDQGTGRGAQGAEVSDQGAGRGAQGAEASDQGTGRGAQGAEASDQSAGRRAQGAEVPAAPTGGLP